jgi:hypothetical protein
MKKMKIEHGASQVNWVLLKTTVEEPIANEVDLMCQWSRNDRRYVVNELLRFALAQSADFRKYKEEQWVVPLGGDDEDKPEESASTAGETNQKSLPGGRDGQGFEE